MQYRPAWVDKGNNKRSLSEIVAGLSLIETGGETGEPETWGNAIGSGPYERFVPRLGSRGRHRAPEQVKP